MNALTGFGDTISFGGYLTIGHDWGSGVGSHTVGSGQSLSARRLYVGYDSTGELTIVGGGAATVNSDAIVSNYWAASGTLTVDGPGSTFGSGRLMVGISGTGALEITDGGQVECSKGMVALTGGFTSTAAISGYNSKWTCSQSLYVGGGDTAAGGTGELTINGGGPIATALDVANTLKVWGSGTVNLSSAQIIANEIELVTGATLNMSASSTLMVNRLTGFGDTVSLGGGLKIGHGGGSGAGSHAVGAGQSLSTGSVLVVGHTAPGDLTVTGGGTVWSFGASVGSQATSVGTVAVDGAGSSWTINATAFVGYAGTGMLTIGSGGHVSAGEFLLGGAPSSSGTVTVQDPGSSLNADGDLTVGGSSGAPGELNVVNGAAVDVGGNLRIWWMGAVNIAGGTIHCGDVDPRGGAIDFSWGGFAIDADLTLDGGDLATELFGDPAVVPPMKALGIGGTATLLTPVTLDGGAFSVGGLVNPDFFEFVSGTFGLTRDDLVIGPGEMFGRTVTVTSEQTIEVTNTATVTPAGVLDVQGGQFSAGELVNHGQVTLGGLPSLVGGAILTNHGFVRGDGTISASLHNEASGQVQASAGERLVFAGAGNTNAGSLIADGGTIETSYDLTNTGQASVTDGALRTGGPATNTATGTISGSGRATMRFDGGLVNSGIVGVSFAEADIYGDITNDAVGIVSVAGESHAAFVGDFANSGSVYVGPGSTAVFLGHVSGPGSFPGGGTVEFVDGFSPGNSPAVVNFGGDVTFASSSLLTIELAANDNSEPLAPQYDALLVADDVALGGTLELTWLPRSGDPGSRFGGVYDIVTYAGKLDGTFSGLAGGIGQAYVKSIDYAFDLGDGRRAVRVELYDLLDADADLDGTVNRDDLLALAANFGSDGADWYSGDFNFDGTVNALDYILLKTNFGQLVPKAGTVPEPATLALLAVGGLISIRRRRR